MALDNCCSPASCCSACPPYRPPPPRQTCPGQLAAAPHPGIEGLIKTATQTDNNCKANFLQKLPSDSGKAFLPF